MVNLRKLRNQLTTGFVEKVENWFAILNWGEENGGGQGGFFAESEITALSSIAKGSW